MIRCDRNSTILTVLMFVVIGCDNRMNVREAEEQLSVVLKRWHLDLSVPYTIKHFNERAITGESGRLTETLFELELAETNAVEMIGKWRAVIVEGTLGRPSRRKDVPWWSVTPDSTCYVVSTGTKDTKYLITGFIVFRNGKARLLLETILPNSHVVEPLPIE